MKVHQEKHVASNLGLKISMTVVRKKEYIMQWGQSICNILLQLSDIRAPNHLNSLIWSPPVVKSLSAGCSWK